MGEKAKPNKAQFEMMSKIIKDHRLRAHAAIASANDVLAKLFNLENHIKQDKEVNISPNTTHKDSNKSPKNETDPGDNGVSGEDSNISKEESGKSPKDQREPSEISSGSNETLPDKTKKDKAEPGDSGKGSGTKNKEPKSETGPVDSGEGSGYTNKKDNEGQIDKPIS